MPYADWQYEALRSNTAEALALLAPLVADRFYRDKENQETGYMDQQEAAHNLLKAISLLAKGLEFVESP